MHRGLGLCGHGRIELRGAGRNEILEGSKKETRNTSASPPSVKRSSLLLHSIQTLPPVHKDTNLGPEPWKLRSDEGPTSSLPGLKIPAEVRRQKMAQVIGLLDRETALVDAVKARVQRLTVG